MTDYRKLSEAEKTSIDAMILTEVPKAHHINEHNGYEWHEPHYTLRMVHSGDYCARCLCVHYNCLCSHDQ